MTDVSGLPAARLFTTWGTVLYVDSVSGELRHGPIDTSPENAAFVAASAGCGGRYRQGSIVHRQDGTCEPIACLGERCVSSERLDVDNRSPAATQLELVPLERGLIALMAGGHFLCAQPDGSLHLQNSWCSTWECFLASEDWCGAPFAGTNEPGQEPSNLAIDRKGIAKFIIDARLRAKANARSSATKVLIYGYPAWSHGRVYYDICKELYRKRYIVDIINWQVDHAGYMDQLISYYDLFISALDGMRTLLEIYRVPAEKVIGLSHHEMDIQILIDQMGKEVFERLAGYGVVGYQLFDASVILGVPRHPLVVQLGVDCEEFRAEIPERLVTVGYAGSYSHKTREGLEWKRGEIAEAAAREAGLEFKIAGSTANQISFHDMPDFYKSVDAVLVSSVSEGAQLPIREGAAAGRLVISTPVGDFPLRAAQGTGIVAPIESHKYQKFVTATLKYYKENPPAFVEMCRKIQNAARQLDWPNMIGDWVELIETAKAYPLEQARAHQQAGRFDEAAALFAARAEHGGDAEEKWYARWQHARCLKELGDDEGFLRVALAAFRERSQAGPAMQASVFDNLNLEHEFAFIQGKGFAPPTELCDQMSSFGSDKGGPFHNYTVLYDWLFSRFRNEELALFELGLGTNKVGAPSSMGPKGKPGASLRGWRAYFPRTRIYGADIDADILFQEDRIKTFWTDQREPGAIRELWDKLDGVAFDIMIDDGLHEASANICFFIESVGRLKPGGIYVIEDVGPNDVDLMHSFARSISCVSKRIVFEEIGHPINKADNRLLIFQKA
jgi:glycosyltransferase involved in cell wall biosynthesis